MAVVAALVLLLSLPFVSQLQADSYKALYDGRWIVQHGLPHTEALTVMAHGRRWIDQQWLAEVLFYDAWRVGGDGLVALVALGFVSLAYMILAALMSRSGASIAVVVSCTTIAILNLAGWQFIRAQDVALPLFGALLAICLTDARYDRPRARLALLLPLLVLWANLHGSVLLGAALASTYLLYRAANSARCGMQRPAVACGLGAIAAICTPLATPYGTSIISYYREFVGNPAMARLAVEWAPASFPSLPFFELWVPAAIVALALILASRRRSWPPAVITGAVAITAVAAVVESGSIVWFGMAATALLADVCTRRWPARQVNRNMAVPLTAVASIACALVCAGVVGRTDRSYESLLPNHVMTATAHYAITHPCTLILGDNLSSSALLWQDPWLTGRIAFDARLEEYSPVVLSRFANFEQAQAPNWAATTSGYGVLVAASAYAPRLTQRLERLRSASVISQQQGGVVVVDHHGAALAHACGQSGGANA